MYDLVVKNGTVVDGSGMPGFKADVGVINGRIASIGRIRDKASETIDAEGHVVSPGFIDGHTHMDAQVAWDPLGSCSCWHGVTSVVMGNCGFSLAPCAEADKGMVIRNLERAEDISPVAMEAGINWTWETYAEYLDAVEALPKGINYAGYIGHSALRTYVMGERAFEAKASEDDLTAMGRELANALKAGAIGFSTSRTPNHETADRRPVASRLADWDEVRHLVGVMGDLNTGVFEIAQEQVGRDPERIRDYFDRMKALALESGRPITWGMFGNRKAPDYWRQYFDLLDEVADAGGRMFAQVHSRALNVLLSFRSTMPFDTWELWSDIRAKSLEEQRAAYTDPATRAKLIEIANRPYNGPKKIGTEARAPEYDWLFPLDTIEGPHRSVASIAAERGTSPVDVLFDLALETDFNIFFMQPIANENQDHVLEMIKHPRSVVTFSDSGAHVSQIMDSSLQTHLFAHWVREKEALTVEEAVHQVTLVPASYWGLSARGQIREGFAADLTIFDPATIAPLMPEIVNDLPAGARRLKQKSRGILATVVNGGVLFRDNEHTGALPGQLLRGTLAGS
ncbi:MAG: amidohydrolase [Gammaproteobacteria bacterium]|nr:amidohydrolase [Gammaproteobacteria bacterium]